MKSERNQKKNILVIGSGFGGLAAAIRLQAAGHQVTVLEKRDRPGGRAYVYEDQGFTFDAGPTVITAPHCLEELFDVGNKKMESYIELLPVFPFYRLFWQDGFTFDYSNDRASLLRQIQSKSPGDVDGYNRFVEYTAEVFKEGYVKLADQPFLNWWSMIRVAPQLMRLKAHQSVYSIVSSFIKDRHLREAFSFHSLLVGGNPFETSSIYTLIHYLEREWGVTFPRGGTGALVRALVKLLNDLGGRVLLNEEVAHMGIQNGKVQQVRTKSGSIFEVDAVVSNADVMHTYKDLLKGEALAAKQTRKLEKSRYSMSLFLIYFGTKKKYPHLAHHNVLFGPRYKELLKDIFKNGVLAEDFSLYLHAPSLTDPSMAPEGCEAFYVLSPVPHLGHGDIDWDVEGPRYAAKIMDDMERRYIPGLKENLVTQRIFTPKDFETQLNSHLGAAFSLEPVLTQSAFFRTHNRDDKIPNLYFVGAGTHPGAGVPGVINSAKATAQLLLQDLPAPQKTREEQAVPTGLDSGPSSYAP